MTGTPSSARMQKGPLLREVKGRKLRTPDGVDLFYQVLGREDAHAPVLMFANGLGARLYAWEPLIERLRETHRLVSWDYRGLFGSQVVAGHPSLAVMRHAEDAVRILDQEGVQQASFAGWSMGVQVALEIAAQFPARVDRLVLLNGTHGHALETGLQPLWRVPWLPRLIERVIEVGLRSPRLVGMVRRVAQSELNIRAFGGTMARLRKNPAIEDIYRLYVYDVFGRSFPNYLRLFLELNAHSVYHHLPEIEHAALVISGGLDLLTPAYQSAEIARRMPNAEALHLRGASHFALLEYSEEIVGRIARFLGLGA